MNNCLDDEKREAMFHAENTLTSIGFCGSAVCALLAGGAGYLLGTVLSNVF